MTARTDLESFKSEGKGELQRRRLAQTNVFATIRPRTCFQGLERCETVLQNTLVLQYHYAMLIGYARVSTDDQDTGETRSSRWAMIIEKVHPRVCGGNVDGAISYQTQQGPSPRVRGKLQTGLIRASEEGSIPACAGETPSEPPSTRPMTVHPRVCGGNRNCSIASRSLSGPSPRVRGKPEGMAVYEGKGGSIPACAGETLH